MFPLASHPVACNPSIEGLSACLPKLCGEGIQVVERMGLVKFPAPRRYIGSKEAETLRSSRVKRTVKIRVSSAVLNDNVIQADGHSMT